MKGCAAITWGTTSPKSHSTHNWINRIILSFGTVECDSYCKNLATSEHCQRGYTDAKLVICYGQLIYSLNIISATTRDNTEETESTRTVYNFNEACERFERLQ